MKLIRHGIVFICWNDRIELKSFIFNYICDKSMVKYANSKKIDLLLRGNIFLCGSEWLFKFQNIKNIEESNRKIIWIQIVLKSFGNQLLWLIQIVALKQITLFSHGLTHPCGFPRQTWWQASSPASSQYIGMFFFLVRVIYNCTLITKTRSSDRKRESERKRAKI